MACNGIFFNGRCFPIYEVELKWPPKDPDPDPWRHVFDDIRVLVTIDRAIARISDRRLRETLGRSIRDAAGSLSLPEGMELGDRLFSGEKVLEAAE